MKHTFTRAKKNLMLRQLKSPFHIQKEKIEVPDRSTRGSFVELIFYLLRCSTWRIDLAGVYVDRISFVSTLNAILRVGDYGKHLIFHQRIVPKQIKGRGTK